MGKTPTTLIIMDGFGLTQPGPGNAVSLANTPVLDRLWADHAHTTLSASGLDVGLPEGQMGNSEVGHTNIGGGRVVFQDLPRISRAIEDGTFFANEAYNKAVDDCLQKGTRLHLCGLLSDGGVHSHIQHLYALLELARRKGLDRVYIHAFLDGRDVSPTSGKGFVADCAETCRRLGVGKIATVMGRYYAMDRDNRWERVQLAYDAMVYGEGNQNPDPVDAVAQSYVASPTSSWSRWSATATAPSPITTASFSSTSVPTGPERSHEPSWTRTSPASSGSFSPPPTSAIRSTTPPCPTCWWRGPVWR